MTLRRTVLLVALLNLAYFGVEFAVAIAIGSVSLFADSVDFLETRRSIFSLPRRFGRRQPLAGMALAGILLVPALATLWTAWRNSRCLCRLLQSLCL
jgi:Co/Zn/Cd efflux system component